MKKEDANRPCRIWLDNLRKIASFHSVVDYELHEFLNRKTFECYTLALIGAGYRFQ